MARFNNTFSAPAGGADFGNEGYSAKASQAHGFANFYIKDAEGNPVKWGYLAFKPEGNEQLQRIAEWLEQEPALPNQPTRIARLVAKSDVTYQLNKPKSRVMIDLDAL